MSDRNPTTQVIEALAKALEDTEAEFFFQSADDDERAGLGDDPGDVT